MRPRYPAAFTCPECGGALADAGETGIARYACHVGHVFGADSLVAQHEAALERALWTALRTLEESAALRREMAARAMRGGLGGLEEAYLQQASQLERRAEVIRNVVERDAPEQAEVLRQERQRPQPADVS